MSCAWRGHARPPAEWAVILDRMVAYGMPMLPGDRELILEYLATRLGQ